MSPTTFFILSLITILTLIFIRRYWLQLLIAKYVIKVLTDVSILSLMSACLWNLIFVRSWKGFGWTLTYFYGLYIGICIVVGLVAMDAFNIFSDWLGSYIKRLLK